MKIIFVTTVLIRNQEHNSRRNNLKFLYFVAAVWTLELHNCECLKTNHIRSSDCLENHHCGCLELPSYCCWNYKVVAVNNYNVVDVKNYIVMAVCYDIVVAVGNYIPVDVAV